MVLVNPAVHTDRKDVLALPVLKHVVASFPGIANDIKKPGVDEHGYDRTPLKAARSMMAAWKTVRADLPKVTSAAADLPLRGGPRGRPVVGPIILSRSPRAT